MIKKLFFGYLFIWGIGFAIAQQAYYNDVDLTTTGLSLKQALATKITSTHSRLLFYTHSSLPDTWDATMATDFYASNTNQVILFYGWEAGTDADITNDISRDQNLRDNGSSALFVWNREHVFPKSLANPSLSTNDPGPGTDAHNLRPADKQRNTLRNNKPFAAGAGTASGDVTNGWYPGDEWKGDVARIIMYMYLRYGDQCLPTAVGVGSATSTPDAMIDLFLQWNVEDPVSDLEKTRNSYHENLSNSYSQGNRNPFIDNPYLATRIWGGPDAQDIWGIYTALSVSEVTNASFSLYPNPVSGNTVSLRQTNNEQIDEVQIFSITAKKLKTIQNPSNRLDLSDLASGVYLIKIFSNKAVAYKKLIKTN